MPTIRENGLVYLGDSSFLEIPAPPASRDDYGLDEMTRSFAGRNSQLDEFLRRYPAGTADTAFYNAPGRPQRYAAMFIVGAPSINIERAFTTVSFRLVGKIGTAPAEPLVTIIDDTDEDTIQLQAIVGDTNPILTVDYDRQKTTYLYSVPVRPAAPKYVNGALQAGDIKIARKRGLTKFNGEEFGPIKASCVVEQRLVQFQRIQEGQWWRCAETWAWVLVQSRTFFSPDLRTVVIV